MDTDNDLRNLQLHARLNKKIASLIIKVEQLESRLDELNNQKIGTTFVINKEKNNHGLYTASNVTDKRLKNG